MAKTKRATNWADRQKAAGTKLELSAYPARDCWKKYYKGKTKYFNYPITKEGYESALRDWLNYKAEADFEQPYMGLIQHHIDVFKPVQKYFDETLEQTTKEKRLAVQVDHFLHWLDEALANPADTFPEIDFSSPAAKQLFQNKAEVEQFNFARAAWHALSRRKEFLAEFDTSNFGFEFALSEEWQEKVSFTESDKKLPQTVGYWVDDYLKAKGDQALNGEIEICTYRDAAERLGKFRDWIGERTPITKIDSEVVKSYHSHLTKQKYANKRLYFQFFKTFVLYCWEEEACNLEHLPKKLTSKLLVFREQSKNKKELVKRKHEKLWSKEDIKKLLDSNDVPDRFKCWVLLMLNCSFTQTDLNDLKRDEIDLEQGRIIRIRKKAAKYPNPPVVNYKLWDKTKEYLKKEMDRCTDEVYALQASFGARIISETLTVDEKTGMHKTTKADNASRGWQHVRKKAGFDGLQLKFVKKSGVTALKENLKYVHLDQLWLGQSHRTIADKHYDAKGGRPYKPLDEAIAFIGKQFGIK